MAVFRVLRSGFGQALPAARALRFQAWVGNKGVPVTPLATEAEGEEMKPMVAPTARRSLANPMGEVPQRRIAADAMREVLFAVPA